MLKFDIVTLFPQLFTEHINNLPFKKALEKDLVKFNFWDLKNFSTNNYGSVDDRTYGGGVGMILMIEPIYKSLEEIYGKDIIKNHVKGGEGSLDREQRIIVLSTRGEKYTQAKARELSKCNQITLICGRYEGIDARVEENIATDVISIGDYVLSGGEIPALTIMESVTRLLPGVLDKKEATEIESFSSLGEVEYPQYTRPDNFMGLKVPEVLLSGNHAQIEEWRRKNSTSNIDEHI